MVEKARTVKRAKARAVGGANRKVATKTGKAGGSNRVHHKERPVSRKTFGVKVDRGVRMKGEWRENKKRSMAARDVLTTETKTPDAGSAMEESVLGRKGEVGWPLLKTLKTFFGVLVSVVSYSLLLLFLTRVGFFSVCWSAVRVAAPIALAFASACWTGICSAVKAAPGLISACVRECCNAVCVAARSPFASACWTDICWVLERAPGIIIAFIGACIRECYNFVCVVARSPLASTCWTDICWALEIAACIIIACVRACWSAMCGFFHAC